jgi:DNA-directed RNA polymerase subunit D
MVSIEKISSSENKMTFLLKKSTPAYSNALRRIMLTQVPVMAIENIEFSKNNSALYDEVLAHRLGLVPLTTDLKSYELPESDEDIENKKAKCTLQLTLKEKGPKTVYASDLKTADPKVKPVFGKTPLVKLLKDQEVELVATAILGKGKIHAKWSACHVWYNYNPKITINMKADFEKVKDLYPPQVFNKKGQIDEKLILEHNLVDAVAHIKEEVVKVEYNDTEFIFTVESWGQLPPKEIISESINILDSKLNELAKLVK